MKRFHCLVCNNQIYFENSHCGHCGHTLGFRSADTQLLPLVASPPNGWCPAVRDNGPDRYRFCDNVEHAACNWLVPAGADDQFCTACELNRTVPDLHIIRNVELWRRMEIAKRRLIYGLLRLQLPLRKQIEPGDGGIAFDFLAGPELGSDESPAIVTGHADGTITINLAEADDALRERNRQAMAEPYRTLLGHFRHEIGHYYWDRLVRSEPVLTSFRHLFGDERRDYSAALENHYAQGAPADWNERFVSHYASAHPWEDFAETWAHYLHIVDTLETAQAIGLEILADLPGELQSPLAPGTDPYHSGDFTRLANAWLPLTRAINSLNRSMGQPDLYPFVLAPPVLKKLEFIHHLVRQQTQ